MTDAASDEVRAERLRAVGLALQAGDLPRAKTLACEALADGIEHPALLNLRALKSEEEGRLDDSLADLQRAHALAPRDYTVLNAIGLCMARMERFDEAIEAYDKGLALEQGFGPLWFNRGYAFERRGETAVAQRCYEKAVEVAPQHVHALANLAALAARRGDFVTARRYAERALALAPKLPTAVLALAAVELGERRFDLGETQLRDLLKQADLPLADRGLALSQLGDILDAQDRAPAAFAAYVEGNAALRRDAQPRFDGPGAQRVSDFVARLVDYLEGADAEEWSRKAPGPGPGEREHVFLIGFPRSGTTLLENVLAAHPDVISLEEKDTLGEAVRAFMRDPASLSRLAKASGMELAPYRDAYWRRVRQYGGEPRGKVLIDKNPLNTHKLPLIAKLFPRARVLFAVRDPRDVVWSCFRRRFNLNASMYEFLDLADTARLYDLTQRLHALSLPKLAFAEHQVVYESLVKDFDGEVKRACDFIGVEVREEQKDFAARARRGEVATPSAAQLARGLYSEGAGQWRRYAGELAPILPTLAPWVERYGYSAD